MTEQQQQYENTTYCMILTIRYSGEGKTMVTLQRLSVVKIG